MSVKIVYELGSDVILHVALPRLLYEFVHFNRFGVVIIVRVALDVPVGEDRTWEDELAEDLVVVIQRVCRNAHLRVRLGKHGGHETF